jgi:cobalt-zinc-cadmium efflux system outer membrane protein
MHFPFFAIRARHEIVAIAFSLFIAITAEVARSAEAADSASGLSLAEAQAAALRERPELVAAEAEARALEGAERQAALRPNPDLVLDVEDVAGTGAFENTSEAQTTLSVFQPIELGGDRRARTAVAAQHRALASFDLEAQRLDVLADTANAFVEVLIAQEEVHHAGELVDLAVRERGAAAERVRGGAALAVDETRARFTEDEARIHEARGRSNLEAARLRLAATWGAEAPDFERAAGDLQGVSPPPPLADLALRLGANPDLARFEAVRAERDAVLAGARARRIPNPLVGAGVRHLAGPNDTAFVFEVAVPLPIFDRQQGAITEAAERVTKASAERKAAERAARTALVAEHARWGAAYQEVVAIRDRLLPGAERSRAELRQAYATGRVSQLDALAAWRTEFETIDRMLHQLGEYHEARIAAERLVGGSVDALR